MAQTLAVAKYLNNLHVKKHGRAMGSNEDA